MFPTSKTEFHEFIFPRVKGGGPEGRHQFPISYPPPPSLNRLFNNCPLDASTRSRKLFQHLPPLLVVRFMKIFSICDTIRHDTRIIKKLAEGLISFLNLSLPLFPSPFRLIYNPPIYIREIPISRQGSRYESFFDSIFRRGRRRRDVRARDEKEEQKENRRIAREKLGY